MAENRVLCDGCVHRVELPGDCHIGCSNWLAAPDLREWNGCGLWPVAFDPAIVRQCPGRSEDEQDCYLSLPVQPGDVPVLDLVRALLAAGRL